MPCCGQSRREFVQNSADSKTRKTTKTANSVPASYASYPSQRKKPGNQPDVAMKYLGSTRLVAVGPLTGRRYRFSHPLAVVLVDYRDAALMVGLRQLAVEKTPSSP